MNGRRYSYRLAIFAELLALIALALVLTTCGGGGRTPPNIAPPPPPPPSIGTTEWVHTWGGENHDEALALSADASGNVYTAGTTRSSGAGTDDVLVLKHDANGNRIWEKTWGGDSRDCAYAVASGNSSGNIYVAGYTTSFGAGSTDMLLLKYHADGALVWARTWGGTGYEGATTIEVDGEGNLVIAGSSTSFGDFSDVVVLKYDPEGSVIWSSRWHGDEAEKAEDIAMDTSGNLYVIGVSRRRSGTQEADVLLLKYTVTGDLLWVRTWRGCSLQYASALSTDAEGNAYVAGWTLSSDGESRDLLLLKYSPTGDLLWSRTWGRNGNDLAQAVAVSTDGRVWTLGRTSQGMLLLLWDRDGNCVTARVWGGPPRYPLYADGCALLLDATEQMSIAGAARDIHGFWQDIEGEVSSPTGVVGTPDGEESIPEGVETIPEGLETEPEGVVDVGGGGSDLLIMKYDPR